MFILCAEVSGVVVGCSVNASFSVFDLVSEDITVSVNGTASIEIDSAGVSGVISGSFFIERVFAIPGAGQYFIQATTDRDVPILMGLTLLYAAIYIIAIFR